MKSSLARSTISLKHSARNLCNFFHGILTSTTSESWSGFGSFGGFVRNGGLLN
jgi:hypothetical protein